MPLDRPEHGVQFVNQNCRNEERDPQPQRIRQQKERSLCGTAGRRRHHECGTEKRADARRQADGIDHAEQEGGKYTCDRTSALHSFEKRQADDVEIGQPEHDHERAAYNVDGSLMPREELTERSGEQTEQGEHRRKAEDERQRTGERAVLFVGVPCEIRDVQREHRQHARRNEGNEPFEKSDKILHKNLHRFWLVLLYQINARKTVTLSLFRKKFRRKQEKSCRLNLQLSMRVKGLEPSRSCPHKNLNLARLPIPPHPHTGLFSRTI